MGDKPTGPVEAVMFDFDGTLTAQGAIDFAAIRSAVGVPGDVFILEHIERLAEEDRRAALAVVEQQEMAAAERSHPNEGAEEAVQQLAAMGLPLGIVTRNGRASVVRALENFSRVGLHDFQVVVTRDDGLPTKPAPDQLLAACAHVGVAPERTMMVGDFRLDVESGRAAGALTVYLLDRDGEGAPAPDGSDFVIDSLHELPPIVRGSHAEA